MKHIDINPHIEAIRNIELQQLADALRSHPGNKVVFDKGAAGKTVTIAVHEGGFSYELAPHDLYPGAITCIVDAIPEHISPTRDGA